MNKRWSFWSTIVALALVVPVLSGVHASIARADDQTQSATEMLQDGLDALIDRQQELARQLFEHLIQAFPQSTEAARAEQELGALADEPSRLRERAERAPFADRASGPELRMTFAVEAGDRVFFAENSAVIGGRARALLEAQARWLAKRPDLKVTIIGRSDDGGSADAARTISAGRAEAVRERLVANGVASSRIVIDARGMSDPIATCRSALCQAQNRHAETFIGSTTAAEISE